MKKFKYIIVLFVMGLISFSCTDLDEEIFSEITTDNYYQNSNNIYAALVNNYAKAFSTGWSDARYFLQEVTADQLMIPTRGKHGYNGGEYVQFCPAPPDFEGFVAIRTLSFFDSPADGDVRFLSGSFGCGAFLRKKSAGRLDFGNWFL